ncbi:MAG: AIR carboxylase family protein [Acidobacteriota bacterium]
MANPLVVVMMGSDSDWKGVIAAGLWNSSEFRMRSEFIGASHAACRGGVRDKQRGQRRQGVYCGRGGGGAFGGSGRGAYDDAVLGVPMTSVLNGMDSLMSTAQMPAGIPVGTLAIGKAGAINAALLAVAILATSDAGLNAKLKKFREEQTAKILSKSLPDVV